MRVLVVSLLIVALVYGFGGMFGGEFDDEWYDSVKPGLAPPNWVFGVVWPVLYLLIGLSLYFTFIGAKKKQKKEVQWAYGSNLVLNAIWSPLFFGLHLVGLAFVDLLLVFGTGIWMFKFANKIDKKAAWMLVPYLLWLAFAGVLNVQAWLNL